MWHGAEIASLICVLRNFRWDYGYCVKTNKYCTKCSVCVAFRSFERKQNAKRIFEMPLVYCKRHDTSSYTSQVMFPCIYWRNIHTLRIFYVHVTAHRNKFLYNKTNRCTNFPNLFWLLDDLNLLEPEFYISILANPVGKMRIIQEPNNVALWNKRHFEEKRTEIMQHV